MRNGQNKRMRGRNRKGQNPLTRVYESNGPDVKIRGTASHVAEKYVQLARDAQASGDPVAAENYFQHAEHYFRMIAAAQEQFRQSQPYFRPEGEPREDAFEEMDDDLVGDAPFGVREPQGYPQREAQQPYPPRDQQQPYPARDGQAYQGPREQQAYPARSPSGPGRPQQHTGDPERLPAFITGNGPQPQPNFGQQNGGFEGGQVDRFPLHRRRRRRHGPRPDMTGGQGAAQQNDDAGGPPAGGPHGD